ncbi:MAG: ribonuclease HII [Candidatus Kerfeldbacteria bacterium]|nr:ribonuclease HII [Candidatus Kerfeldbacteria bacterium]
MTVPNTRQEKRLHAAGHRYVAGSEEVGKGAWAGPLVAAAVILPEGFSVKGIRDSKQLSPSQREKLFVRITKRATSWAVAVVERQAIDRVGIQPANVRAIQQALQRLHVQPDAVLVDAVKVKHGKKPVTAIVKGDAKIVSIAAASIVAKVVRDTLMHDWDRQHPGYGFAQHKGYGTDGHRANIKLLGLSPIHRRSFEPMKSMLAGRKRGRP